jgi:MFS family permease
MPPNSFVQNLRALPPAAWILFAGTFVNRFGTFVIPFLVIYLTRQGYSMAQAGAALGVYGAGQLIASIAGGHLADRIGRRYTIALSMFSSAAAMMALSQAHVFAAILTTTFLAGVSTELYRPASHALIGDLIPPERRVAAFAMYRFAVNLGFAAGPATAGFLADHSFFYVFAGDAATSVGFGLIALLALPNGLRTFTKDERVGEALYHAFRNRAFVLFLIASVCMASVDFQIGSTVALHVKDLGFSSSTYGMLISLNGVLIVLFELAITAWVQRFRPQPAIAIGYLFGGVGFALTGIAHTIPALAGTVVLWTIGEMVSSPAAGAYAIELAPEKYRGRYMGIWVLTWSIGMIVGPPVGSMILAHNPALLWSGCFVLGVVGALIVMIKVR